MPYLFLLFVIMPIVEIAVLIKVGGAIGGWTTIGVVILTAILGTAMLRHQGMATMTKAQQRMNSGEMPAQQLLEGLLLVIGGVLLLTPGFITDFFGFCTLFPASREFLAKQLAARSMGNFNVFVGGASVNPQSGQHSSNSAGPSVRQGPQSGPFNNQYGQTDSQSNSHSNSQEAGKDRPNVIDGDYERLD